MLLAVAEADVTDTPRIVSFHLSKSRISFKKKQTSAVSYGYLKLCTRTFCCAAAIGIVAAK